MTTKKRADKKAAAGKAKKASKAAAATDPPATATAATTTKATATKATATKAATKAAPTSGRKHARVNLGMLVQVNVDTIAAFKQDHCANISEGGMFLRTDELRPLGLSLFFQFTLKDGGALIEGMAKVVRIVEQPGAEPRGMGVEFESLLEPSLSIVKALVDERRGA